MDSEDLIQRQFTEKLWRSTRSKINSSLYIIILWYTEIGYSSP